MEEVLVEKIAYEYWRIGIAASPETNLFETLTSIKFYEYRLRYQTTMNRQFYQAINQLPRVQRLRAGGHVPAPVNIQVSHDIPGLAEGESAAP